PARSLLPQLPPLTSQFQPFVPCIGILNQADIEKQIAPHDAVVAREARFIADRDSERYPVAQLIRRPYPIAAWCLHFGRPIGNQPRGNRLDRTALSVRNQVHHENRNPLTKIRSVHSPLPMWQSSVTYPLNSIWYGRHRSTTPCGI